MNFSVCDAAAFNIGLGPYFPDLFENIQFEFL